MLQRYSKKDWERYNLQRDAEELNRKYFNNELDLNFPFKYGRFYRSYGLVKGRKNRATGEVTVTSLEISNRYDLDRETYLGILAHELIHVKLMQNGRSVFDRNTHGPIFCSEVNKLRAKGLDVPLSEDVSKQTMDTGEQLKKPVYVIVKDGQWILVTRSYGTQADLDRFNDHMAYTSYVRKTPIKLEYYMITNPIVRNVPIARSLKTSKGRFYKMEPEVYESLIKDKTGEVIIKPDTYRRTGKVRRRIALPYMTEDAEVFTIKDVLENLNDVVESLGDHLDTITEYISAGRKEDALSILKGLKDEFKEGVLFTDDLGVALHKGELVIPLPRRRKF